MISGRNKQARQKSHLGILAIGILLLSGCGIEPPKARPSSQGILSTVAGSGAEWKMQLSWSRSPERGRTDGAFELVFFQSHDHALVAAEPAAAMQVVLIRATSCCGKEIPFNRALHRNASGFYSATGITVPNPGFWTFELVLRDAQGASLSEASFEVEVR